MCLSKVHESQERRRWGAGVGEAGNDVHSQMLKSLAHQLRD